MLIVPHRPASGNDEEPIAIQFPIHIIAALAFFNNRGRSRGLGRRFGGWVGSWCGRRFGCRHRGRRFRTDNWLGAWPAGTAVCAEIAFIFHAAVRTNPAGALWRAAVGAEILRVVRAARRARLYVCPRRTALPAEITGVFLPAVGTEPVFRKRWHGNNNQRQG